MFLNSFIRIHFLNLITDNQILEYLSISDHCFQQHTCTLQLLH